MTRPLDTFLTQRTYPGGREVIDVGRHSRANIVIDREPRAVGIRVVFSNLPTLRSPCTGIKLRVCPDSPALLEVAGVPSPKWHMAAGLLPIRRSHDMFSLVMSVIYDQIVRDAFPPDALQPELPLCYQNPGRNPDFFDSELSSSIVSSMRIVAGALRDAAIYATRLCDPNLLRVVRRFPPCMRVWLYRTLEGDSSRRLAQLATSCPGALIFAFALQEHDPTRVVGSQLLDSAIQGLRLNRLLTEAVANWAAAATDWDFEEEPQLARPWLRILEAGGLERRRLETDQRLLIRRAGPRVSPTYVLLPPPLAFAAEDIPVPVFANARWFRTLKTRIDLVSPHPDQAETLLRELAQFASRHSRVLHPPRRKAGMRRRMGQLIDYVLASGRHTSRKTCPQRLLAECKEWHRTVFENLDLCDLSRAGPVTPETEFPDSVSDSWSSDRVVVARIRTVGDLIREGRSMRSCVGTRARTALQGRCAFYSVEVDGKPITVELTRLPNGRSYVSEMAGFANREVQAEELAAMKP